MDSLHNFHFQVSNKETDSKIKMYMKNWVGQAPFENFDFLVKVKGPFGESIFFLTFFLKIILGGSDRVRFPSQSGSNRVDWTNRSDRGVEDDVIEDVTFHFNLTRFLDST